MNQIFTEADFQAAVTDPGSAQRGQGIATLKNWGNLGFSEHAIWGECAGSGSKPYLVAIDLVGPAFKCSCPSRVFPCKHGAGLMLLVVRSAEIIPVGTEPPWVEEWLSKRQDKQDAKPKAQASKEVNTSPKAPSESADVSRLKRMASGLADFELWLIDAMRMGLAAFDAQPLAAWEARAAQLVDAQLPGLATTLRALAQNRKADRSNQLLAGLGEMYLLIQAFNRLDGLPENAKTEVLQQLGVNLKKEDLLATQPAVQDTWLVVGQATKQEERMTARRTWLHGQKTGQYAMLLDYAFAGQGFTTTYLPLRAYMGALHSYPGLYPLRALAGEGFALTSQEPAGSVSATTIEEAFSAYAQAVAANPWLRAFPMQVLDLVPERHKSTWYLRQAGHLLPMLCQDEVAWQMAAESGGHPLTVFGEWDGYALTPLSYTLQTGTLLAQ